jgi:hypothetical protein
VLLDAWTGGRGLRDHEQAELQRWLVLWQLHHARVFLQKGAVREAEQAIEGTRELVERGLSSH